ncbi:von Willebrand factor A domain-containing protein 7-like [Acropora millepora]|uniref:von Willebrand factor A domain-containing protein 7-like n=1 Tax=Acropora millepora TaxID=45264 RepID=UPI001CF45977|nr:von Willebrand factor A domain-containing protein 7-like [Acropora millepora]
MAKQACIFVVFSIWLLFVLCAHETFANVFSSLHFTRQSLMQFSRGNERTVEILTPEKTNTAVKPKNIPLSILTSSMHAGFEAARIPEGTRGYSTARPKTAKIPVTKTVVTYQKKRKVYRQRSSPSNKFLEVLNVIERAVANANASGDENDAGTLSKLDELVVKAVRSKRFHYGRQVLGRIMNLLSLPGSSKRRGKRSSQNQPGSNFMVKLRQQLGYHAFDRFMAVQGDVSLMFVMDDTGSMGREIEAVKSIAIDIMNYDRQAPIISYILSPFNDPYPSGNPPVVSMYETEAAAFVDAINDLRAHGGGDCPEYAFTGMLEALYEDPEWGSPMYVFTDADPKDATEDKIEEVKALARADVYGVTINFLTTGYCGSQLHPAFRQLAEATSGQVIALADDGELEQLNSLTGGSLDGNNVVSFGSNVSNRKKRRAQPAGESRYSIPVDDSMEKMVVTVSTARRNTNGRGITLKGPDNSIVVSGKLSLSQISVYQIDNPKSGAWTLSVSGSNGEHEFFVKSSSETNVDFEHYFITTLPGRSRRTKEVPVSHPTAGKLNTLVITLAGSEKVDKSSLRLQLISKDGSHISDVTLQPRDSVHFSASVVAPAQVFKLKLRGHTRSGSPFQRISRQIIEPSKVLLRVWSASNDYTLPHNRNTVVHFQLCNYGDRERFQVTVKDRLGYLVTRRIGSRMARRNSCPTLPVRARATRTDDIGKIDSIFIKVKGTRTGTVASSMVQLFVVPASLD